MGVLFGLFASNIINIAGFYNLFPQILDQISIEYISQKSLNKINKRVGGGGFNTDCNIQTDFKI